MNEKGESSVDLYDRCCEKALLESLLSSKFLMDIYGYGGTSRLVRDTINLYRGKHRWTDEFGERLVKTLTADLDKDLFLNGMKIHDPESYGDGKESMRRAIDTIGRIMSESSTTYNEQLEFLRYFIGIRTTCDNFDFEKLEMNRSRVLKAESPQDSFPALKDQFNQIFEDVCRPYSKNFTDVVSHYPGMKPKKAYAAVEDLLCACKCYQFKDDYKSDLREIRNAFAHEKYRVESKLVLTLNDGSTVEFGVNDMMFRTTMMQYKCMFVNMVLPIMNIEILRRMALRF